jgi:hypothetical protein
MPSKTCGLREMISASRGAEAMIVTISDMRPGLVPISENSWIPAGNPGDRKASNRISASSARLVAPNTLSSSGVSSVRRSRASTDWVAR